MGKRVELTRKLNAFDVTSLVVGSIIGADIYVAAALGAKLVGPFSLIIWLAAGLIAIVISLSFSYSATLLPRVGGPYSYVREVAGPFAGFIVGWSLLLAEWFSLAVFPVAFTRYFTSMFPMVMPHQTILKGTFILVILLTNLYSVKAAGRFNDALTIGKLAPLVLLMLSGVVFIALKPASALSRFSPLIRGDVDKMGQALILIFWAYAGFELSTLPADEIEAPQTTIPKAIVVGMLIVIVFYMVTNFVIIGVMDHDDLAASKAPLMSAASTIFSFSPALSIVGGAIIGFGALISVLGADESGTIGTSRLAFAMSLDGLLPHIFSRVNEKYGTPQRGLLIICLTAFVASAVGTLTDLINSSVFLLAFTYVSTCYATIRLEEKFRKENPGFKGGRIVPILGMAFSLLLISQVRLRQIVTSLALLSLGAPIYVFFSPKKELTELKTAFLSRGNVLKRTYEQGERFLAHPVRHLKWAVYRLTNRMRAWRTQSV